ncbi:MAG TPA: universal stress protein, partial [Candidatus Binatia bacterium]|nr:universal stress protein [Candidatus Binatia bacterium]
KTIRRILCPVDFSAVSDREMELAIRLAERFQAELVLQHNLASGAALGVSWMHEQEHHGKAAAQETEARKKLAALLSAVPKGVRERTRGALTYGALHHCVENLAKQADADLVVIGTHGRAGADHPSETERLITHSPCPVLTTRDDAPQQWLPALDQAAETIPTLVPVDFSTHSLAALRYAIHLRETLPLELTVLYVADREDYGAGWAEGQLSKELPAGARPTFRLEVRKGGAVEQILAEESVTRARLVVMGAHAQGFFERMIFKGPPTSREVLHRSPCPVWFVPASARL